MTGAPAQRWANHQNSMIDFNVTTLLTRRDAIDYWTQ